MVTEPTPPGTGVREQSSHIAAHPAVIVEVDTHVEHDLAVTEAIASEHPRTPGGADDDIRLAADNGDVARAGMA